MATDLLDFRPPALPVHVQAPAPKGLERGGKRCRHLLCRLAQLLLLHSALRSVRLKRQECWILTIDTIMLGPVAWVWVHDMQEGPRQQVLQTFGCQSPHVLHDPREGGRVDVRWSLARHER